MPHVYDYILNKFKIDSNKITLIYGVPINLPVIDIDANNNIDNKINILFSSHKYSSHGVDKGFDVFIRVAKVFEKDSRFTFSVIGGFNKGDMVVNAQNVAFIPELTDNQLAEKMKNYDIILSPNRSHVLHHGAFDGFPTGSVLHAVNSGCLMMITDDWDNSNLLGLIDGLDFIRISCSVMEIKQKLEHLANEPNKMKQIALNGKLKLKTLIDTNTQLERRMSIISSYL
jgi:hypothetical protein